MTFASVKSKVHLFTDYTVIYLVAKCTVDCLRLQQDLLSLETGNRIKKWISMTFKCSVSYTSRKRKSPMCTRKASIGSTLEYWQFSHWSSNGFYLERWWTDNSYWTHIRRTNLPKHGSQSVCYRKKEEAGVKLDKSLKKSENVSWGLIRLFIRRKRGLGPL